MSFDKEGGSCTGLSSFPNATITDYGSISGQEATESARAHSNYFTDNFSKQVHRKQLNFGC